jgi:hypothetical protein
MPWRMNNLHPLDKKQYSIDRRDGKAGGTLLFLGKKRSKKTSLGGVGQLFFDK